MNDQRSNIADGLLSVGWHLSAEDNVTVRTPPGQFPTLGFNHGQSRRSLDLTVYELSDDDAIKVADDLLAAAVEFAQQVRMEVASRRRTRLISGAA